MTRPAVLVPDEGTWLLWGTDPTAQGLSPVVSPASAAALLVPSHIPSDLVPAVRDLWERLPARRELVAIDAPMTGGAATHAALASDDHTHDGHDHDGLEHHGHEHAVHGDHESHGGHDHHAHEHHGYEHDAHGGDHEGHGHGGHDHHAMMAVTGDPSSDGLVMEDLEVVIGPVGSPLPTGLVARMTLDGDVVCSADISPTLASDDPVDPDPTTPATWRAALDVAGGDGTSWIPEVELERAASHARFFLTLGSLLGWAQLADRARTLARALQSAPGDRVAEHARTPAEALAKLVDSRRMRTRLRGVATLSEATAAGLAGPNARASGVLEDARLTHAGYEALGFRPVVETGGDAHARALVRAREIMVSLDLLAAWAAGQRAPAVGTPAVVEGPRGPVEIRPSDGGRVATALAPTQLAALDAAGSSVHRLEWPDALLAIASFDLSGWRVA